MTRLWMALLWLLASLAWVQADHVIRDGDEDGHVGAAELFEQQLAQGRLTAFASDAWRGDLGEYPPLFPAIVGAAWHLSGRGQPSRWSVRGVCLLSLLLAAWATGRTAATLLPRGATNLSPKAAEDAAFTAVLALPLANGLARHFMPEGALVGALGLTVLAATRAGQRPSLWRSVLLGLTLGLGLLVKQTFAPLALLPALLAGWRQGWRWLLTLATASAVAGPWYGQHMLAQLDYVGRSAQANAHAGLALTASYYPLVTGWIGLGPVLGLLALAGAWVAWRGRHRDASFWLGAAWLVGGLLILTLVPKKYPRLMAPLAPGAALWMGALAARQGLTRRLSQVGLLLSAAWLAWTSLRTLPPPSLIQALHPRCMQTWLRPPQPDDLGLSAVARAVRSAPSGPVAVIAGPSIPCEVQTTHDWAYHLQPYLRREGLEREVFQLEEGPPPRGSAVVVDWSEGSKASGQEIRVAPLGRSFWIRQARAW